VQLAGLTPSYHIACFPPAPNRPPSKAGGLNHDPYLFQG